MQAHTSNAHTQVNQQNKLDKHYNNLNNNSDYRICSSLSSIVLLHPPLSPSLQLEICAAADAIKCKSILFVFWALVGKLSTPTSVDAITCRLPKSIPACDKLLWILFLFENYFEFLENLEYEREMVEVFVNLK